MQNIGNASMLCLRDYRRSILLLKLFETTFFQAKKRPMMQQRGVLPPPQAAPGPKLPSGITISRCVLIWNLLFWQLLLHWKIEYSKMDDKLELRSGERQVSEMVFCYQNCSDLLWEKIVLVIKKNFWEKGQWKVRTIFGKRMLFLTFSWRFLISNKLKQLEFNLEKIIGI